MHRRPFLFSCFPNSIFFFFSWELKNGFGDVTTGIPVGCHWAFFNATVGA